MVLELIILATVFVSLASLVGIFVIPLKEKTVSSLLIILISFATGTLLAGAFLDLLPEATELLAPEEVFKIALIGMLVFFIIEKFIYWHHHHHHKHEQTEKPLAYLNLIGDGLHNFFDGAAIAAAFIVSPEVGISTTIAIIAHEIPQEIGDFSLLIYSGFSRNKALLFNLVSAALSILGALVFFYFSSVIENVEAFALAFTAGMFIYIAGADLVPELLHHAHHERKGGWKRELLQLLCIIAGIMLIYAVGLFAGHA